MNRNRLFPIVLLIVGIGLMLAGSRGCSVEIPWPIPPIVSEKYPDAWLVFVEESSERDIDFAVLLQNKKWTDSLNQRGINWRVYDRDQEEAKSYLPDCKEFPTMLFVNPDGRMLRAMTAPKTSKEVDLVISEVMGK